MKYLILLLSLVTHLSWAIPENGHEVAWKRQVLPYFLSMNVGEFKNAQGLKIKYYSRQRFYNDKLLVILPGRTEPAMKYAELIYDLRWKGYDIFIMDHQGQGASERMLKDSHKGHVLCFNDYVRDFEQFMDIVRNRSSKPAYLVAHSMGGAISALYLARHPEVFQKAALSAPMMEINTRPYSETVARYYAKLLVKVGKGNNYAPDRGPYVLADIKFENNEYTHSEVRFNVEKNIFTVYPELALGGPTARWVYEALKGIRYTDQLDIRVPVLLLQAGKDQVVKPGRQNSFCKESFCTTIKYPGSNHEILMEKDEVRDHALESIDSFFKL